MRLRSTAPALLLQSPVQRAGRAIGFPDAERRAAARNGWEGHSSLFITLFHYSLSRYVYIRHKSGPIPRRIRIESFGAGDAHIATRFALCRATGRDTDVRRTWVALRHLGPTRAPRGAFPRGLAVVKLSADARTGRRSRASPLWPNRARLASLSPPHLLPSPTKSFLPAKVVFAGLRPGVFR